MTSKVGFIGLGLMGSGMAGNIVRKGFDLSVMAHRNREALERLVEAGAHEVGSAREMAETCDVIVICVTGSPQVETIINGPDGIVAAGRALTIVDCSTSDPASTLKLAEQLAGLGITLVDAPLSRTPKEAAEGTLDVMVGGEPEHVEAVRPIIDTFAGRVVHTGPVGTGHTMKLLNNFLSMGYAALYAEALSVGAKAGLSPKVFDSVIRGGRMDCPFYQTFFDYVVNHNPNAHRFTLRNALKDMTYLASSAQSLGVPNPMGAAVRNSFAIPVAMGRGDDYVPTLSDFVASLGGTTLR